MPKTQPKTPRITFDAPRIGYVTLHVNDTAVPGISYVNPWVIDDVTDLLEAEVGERDMTIRLDRENLGMAYLTSTEVQELLLVCDDGISTTDMFIDSSDVRKCARGLADSIEQNLEEWCAWFEDGDEVTHGAAISKIKKCLSRLRAL